MTELREQIDDAMRAIYAKGYEDGYVDHAFPEGSADDGAELRKGGIDPMAVIEGFEQAKEDVDKVAKLCARLDPPRG